MAPDPARFAALLCDYCLDVQAGQQVVVRSSTLAAPLLLALQEELLVREAWPLIRTELPGADEGFWQHARDAHLDGFPPPSWPRRRRRTPRSASRRRPTRARSRTSTRRGWRARRVPARPCARPRWRGAGA